MAIETFATFNASGFPTGFWRTDLYALDAIPKSAVPISDAHWLEFIDNQGLRKWDGEKPVVHVPDVALKAPPMPSIAAAAFGVNVANGDISGLDGGFNIGGAIYNGPGDYLVFFIQPIEGRYAPLFMAGGTVAMTATASDAYSMTIEARSGGVLTDPEMFNMQVFKL